MRQKGGIDGAAQGHATAGFSQEAEANSNCPPPLAHCPRMQFAYLHIVINHLPIMGVPVVLGVLLLGLWARQPSVQHAALLAFAVLGLLTVAVYLTGQAGEDFAEHAPGLARSAIDDHEDMALLALVAVETLALASLYLFLRHGGITLLRRRETGPSTRIPTAGMAVVVLTALVTTGLLGYAGRLGGKISHTEFAQPGAVSGEAEGARRGRGRGRGRD